MFKSPPMVSLFCMSLHHHQSSSCLTCMLTDVLKWLSFMNCCQKIKLSWEFSYSWFSEGSLGGEWRLSGYATFRWSNFTSGSIPASYKLVQFHRLHGLQNVVASFNVITALRPLHFLLHRESKKNKDTKLLAITSPTITRFSKIFSLVNSVVNLQQTHVWIFHHALNMSLHYLVK